LTFSDGAGLGIDDSKSVDYSKLGAKKMRKMAEKEERARVREAMEADRKRRKEQEVRLPFPLLESLFSFFPIQELDLEEQRKAKLEELEKKREEEKELERLREVRALFLEIDVDIKL